MTKNDFIKLELRIAFKAIGRRNFQCAITHLLEVQKNIAQEATKFQRELLGTVIQLLIKSEELEESSLVWIAKDILRPLSAKLRDYGKE